MTEDRSLELSADELRALVDAATRRIIEYVESLPRQPSADTQGGAELARSLVEPLPESGRPYEELLDLVFDRVVRKGFGTAGPGYLAYIPGGGLYTRIYDGHWTDAGTVPSLLRAAELAAADHRNGQLTALDEWLREQRLEMVPRTLDVAADRVAVIALGSDDRHSDR